MKVARPEFRLLLLAIAVFLLIASAAVAESVGAFRLLASFADTARPDVTNKIVFSSNRAQSMFKVWMMNPDGSGVTCLLCVGQDDPRVGRTPAISPDGNQIVYVDGAGILQIIDTNGGPVRTLVSGSSPAWSPDGQRIVFTRLFTATPPTHNRLFIINADGSGVETPLNIPGTSHNNVTPVWGAASAAYPQGRIAFRTSRDGNSEIYVIAPMSMSQTFQDAPQVNVTNSTFNDSFPAWSPQGDKLVFESDRATTVGGNSDIYVLPMNPSPGTVTRITNAASSFHQSGPVWSPDGSKIAFVSFRGGSQEIFVVDATTGTPVDAAGHVNITNNSAVDFDVDWGPAQGATPAANGRIIYQRGPRQTSDIYAVTAGSGVSFGLRKGFHPAVSPDGTKIAFVDNTTGAVSNGEIMVMNADGTGTARRLATPRQGFTPTWSPDGRRLAFVRGDFESVGDNGKGQLYIVDMFPQSAEGSNEVQIPTGTRSISKPSWGATNRIAAACYDPYPGGGTDPKGICVTGDIPSSAAIGSNTPTFTLISGANWNDREPTWSPNGTRIAFMSTRDYPMFNGSEIYSANPDGSNPTRLTNVSDFKSQPSWSPDGTRIVYSRGGTQGPNTSTLRAVNADGSNGTAPTVITNFGSGDVFPNWGAQPTAATPTPSPIAATPTPTPFPRTIGAINKQARPGESVTVPIYVYGVGNEATMSFTINFDRNKFTNVVPVLGIHAEARGAALTTNTSQLADGKLGVLIESPTPFNGGHNMILSLRMYVLPNATPGVYPITFSSTPTLQSVSNIFGELLPTSYEPGNVTVPAGCTLSVSPSSQSFSANGGAGTVNVTQTGSGNACTWRAAAAPGAQPFITMTPVTGSGSGSFTYTIPPNANAFGRSGSIEVVNDAGIKQTIAISQTSGSGNCTYEIDPTFTPFTQLGGHNTVKVKAPAGCSWTATVQNAPWVSITSASGVGEGYFGYQVAAGPDDMPEWRDALIYVNGQTHGIVQVGPSCAYEALILLHNLDAGIVLRPGEKAPSEPARLDTIRQFRDEVLLQSPRGVEYARDYYQHTAEITRTLIFNPSLLTRSVDAVRRYQPVVDSVLSRSRARADFARTGEAVAPEALQPTLVADEEIDEIDDLLKDFAEQSSGQLREKLNRVRSDIRGAEMQSEFGIRVVDGARRAMPGDESAPAGLIRSIAGLFEFAPSLNLFGSATEITPAAENAAQNTSPATPDNDVYGKIPLSFEANRGQVDQNVRFLSRGHGYNLFLTGNEAVISLSDADGSIGARAGQHMASLAARHLNTDAPASSAATATLKMTLDGANNQPRVAGESVLPGKSNYLVGTDAQKWRTDIPNYSRVRYEQVYDGIDLVYYGNQRQLEYDFVVAPGADPDSIRMSFAGSDKVELDGSGDLVLDVAGREVRVKAPITYQETDGVRHEVASRYEVHRTASGGTSIGFAVADYDSGKPLVIDPILAYSSYIGGSGADRPNAITVDADGNAYVIGYTDSPNFPVAGALQPAYGGHPQDIFVAKLNAAGTAFVYSTYIGGSGEDNGNDIAVDSNGNAYITGYTGSANFPTANAAQGSRTGLFNAFVAKLNPSGSGLIYSTYFGGSVGEFGNSIAVDASGNAYVAGITSSPDFPRLNSAQQTYGGSLADAFVAKFNPSGSQTVYSSLIGGNGNDAANSIAVDGSGNAYVAGVTFSTNFPLSSNPLQGSFRGGMFDAFVTKIGAAGDSLAFSTYLGGTEDDRAHRVALDNSGNLYIVGETASPGFPTSAALQSTFGGGGTDAFITKLNPSSSMVYSTFLGGGGLDGATGLAVNAAGNVFLTGFTSSTTFPVVDPFQSTYNGGSLDTFAARLNAAGTGLDFSTYLGGTGTDNGTDIVIDQIGSSYVIGRTTSANFPILNAVQAANGGGEFDAFITKLAANVTVSGRVLTPSGQSLRNAVVSLITPQGQRRTATTSSFGLFSFGNVPVGNSYTVTVGSRRYRFSPRNIQVGGNLDLGDLIGLE